MMRSTKKADSVYQVVMNAMKRLKTLASQLEITSITARSVLSIADVVRLSKEGSEKEKATCAQMIHILDATSQYIKQVILNPLCPEKDKPSVNVGTEETASLNLVSYSKLNALVELCDATQAILSLF